jgi:hypothetical protein
MQRRHRQRVVARPTKRFRRPCELPTCGHGAHRNHPRLGHPDTATRLGNLAATYSDLGRHAEALPLAERAHHCALAALGAEHPTTTWTAGLAAQIRDRLGGS